MSPTRPIQVFSPGQSVMLDKAEMLAHLKARLATVRAACDQGGDLIASIFGVAPKIAQNFADAVHAAVTLGLPEQIIYLENLKDPEPFDPTISYIAQGPTVEDLATVEMNIQSYEAHIEEMEDARNEPDLPPGVAAMMGMGIPMLKDQLQAARQRRDYIRHALEMQAKPIPPVEKEAQ